MASALRRFLAVLAFLLSTTPAFPQTTDVFFGGWSFRPREEGSRPAGLGGAYVAVADGVRTVTSNPAGLALVPQSELAAGTADLWGGVAYSLKRPQAMVPAAPTAGRPTEPGAPLPCPPARPARPFVVAVYAERSLAQQQSFSVVRAPGVVEAGELSATSERLGASVGKGLTRWLQVGATVEWRHLRMVGGSVASAGREPLRQVTLGGDTNKPRVIVGALATFGRAFSPTALRLGVSYRSDLWDWSVERSAVDVVAGRITDEPRLVRVSEPAVFSVGVAWRASDTWLLAAQADHIAYPAVAAALADNDGAPPDFRLRSGWEPRAGLEMSGIFPLGGYFKLRAGMRGETSGRFEYLGDDIGLRQAFRSSDLAFRGAVGASLLAEFYEKAVRFDVDMSQIVAEPRSTISAAGDRRVSFGITVRM